MAAMFTQNIQKMVAHAANAYFEEEDIEMILKVKDIRRVLIVCHKNKWPLCSYET